MGSPSQEDCYGESDNQQERDGLSDPPGRIERGQYDRRHLYQQPRHNGVSRAYLEDVTTAEFCEEGGHGALLVAPEIAE